MQRLHADDDGAFQRWIEREHPRILERIERLTIIDPEYRLDALHQAVPPGELRGLQQIVRRSGPRDGDLADHLWSVWRGTVAQGQIRPGDWVALDADYARKHVRTAMAQLTLVDARDIYWAGSDMNEFFYLPQTFVAPEGHSPRRARQYLQQVVCAGADEPDAPQASQALDRLDIFLRGELARVQDHSENIRRLTRELTADFDEENLGTWHGPDHWRRVAAHSVAVSRSLGVQPLLGVVFAWTHDSQRQDEGKDPGHGPRAAEFVLERSGPGDILGFLSPHEIDTLAHACREHSNGLVDGPSMVQACWDADRLDMWRVNSEPDPDYLCTPWARQAHVIEHAHRMVSGDRADQQQPDPWNMRMR